MANESIINKFVNNLPFELHAYLPNVGSLSACGPGTFHSKRIQKYIQTGDTSHIYKNELDKACFYHDSAYNKYKDVPNRHIADKELMDKAFTIANDQSIDGYQRALASLVYKFFEKKIQLGQGVGEERAILADELHRPIRHNFPRRKVTVSKPNDILACDIIDMNQQKDEGYRYILTAQDIFTKYSYAVPLKSRNSEELIEAFKTIFKSCKPKKIWVDQETGIHSKKFQEFLDAHRIQVYSTASEIKVSVIERFNRTLKEWLYKEFTKNDNTKWLNILPVLVEKYNNRNHSTTKIAPNEAYKAKNIPLIRQRITNYNRIAKKPKLNVGDRVRMYRWKRDFEKGFTPKWTKEIFVIDAVNKRTNPIVYYLKDLNGEIISVPFQQNKSAGFYAEELLKTKL